MLARTSSVPRSSERLSARRRRNRRRALTALAILLLIGLGACIYGLWQKPVRISEIKVYGSNADLGAYAQAAMRGSYAGIIPRDSTFFIPESGIRHAILADHPEIAAVALFRNGFTGLTIKADPRVAIARWCGLSPTPNVEEYCYVFDANGFVYAAADHVDTVINPAKIYAPLAGDTEEPLRASIAPANELPSVFDFARQINTLGSNVTAIVIRNDEVDDLLASGTRLTYVLGHEQTAFTALVSAKDQISLGDGSIEYIDLRFDGKMYVKRKGEKSNQ